MKKLIAILLVVTMIFTFAACGGSDLPEDYVTITDVSGVTFSVPGHVASLNADNIAYTNAHAKSLVDAMSNEELEKEYLFKDTSTFGYLSSDNLIILVTSLNCPMPISSLYDSYNFEETVGSMFGITNVSSGTKSLTNLSYSKVTANIKGVAGQYGKVSGYISIIEQGADVVGIMALATNEYIKIVGDKEAGKTTKEIVKTLELTGDKILQPTSPGVQRLPDVQTSPTESVTVEGEVPNTNVKPISPDETTPFFNDDSWY